MRNVWCAFQDLLKNIIKTESINGIKSEKKESDKENKGKGNGAAATNGSTVKTEGSKTSPLNWMADSAGDKKKSDVSDLRRVHLMLTISFGFVVLMLLFQIFRT